MNVGKPNEETTQFVGGKVVRVKLRDELGLSLDPKDNADPKCRQCFGRGMIRLAVATKDGRMSRVGDPLSSAPPPEDAPVQMRVASCGCVDRVYARNRRAVLSSKEEGAKCPSPNSPPSKP